MHPGVLKTLEFDRIVEAVRTLALTPVGDAALADLRPHTDVSAVRGALAETTEAVRFLARHAWPLSAPAGLRETLRVLPVEGQALAPTSLLGLADFLVSARLTRRAIEQAQDIPRLTAAAAGIAAFDEEIAAIRRRIDPSGDVVDDASPALRSIRDRLRRLRAKLRSTLEGFLRGRDATKYLQDQIITERNGRSVLVLRSEHRGAIDGVVHGASGSGASLFLEPMPAVETNNDIVALEELEAEEVHRILLELSDAFRSREVELRLTLDAAATLDAIQARARFATLVGGVAPTVGTDGAFALRGARHPLLMATVRARLSDDAYAVDESASAQPEPTRVDIMLPHGATALLITGPNTGGKTVALKTAGLLALMAQAGLHIPAEPGSTLPLFQSVYADIGDAQSIAANLSTFSSHIVNLAAMDRALEAPALVLLDEVGSATDPIEGGALGAAVVDHFRQRGALVIATSHVEALKVYALSSENAVCAAFGFEPTTFAPTYKLVYGSPGRSLALEIAARLGLDPSIIAAARQHLSERDVTLAEQAARLDEQLHAAAADRQAAAAARAELGEREARVVQAEEALRAKEAEAKKRAASRLDDRVRDARREVDAVVEDLKRRAAELSASGPRLRQLSTGDAGALRADARAALDTAASRLQPASDADLDAESRSASLSLPGAGSGVLVPAVGARAIVPGFGLEGVITAIVGKDAELDVRGKRMRASVNQLRILSTPQTASPRITVHVDLQERDGAGSADLNVVGCKVDEAISRAEKFLDDAIVGEQRVVRFIHGHGTGQLRRALAEYLQDHPLVARFHAAPMDQGGSGVTVAELKD